ncbi:MAG: 50S ribosomal protein L4 [bacterium]
MPTLNEINDELPEEFQNQPFREGLIHQAVVTYEANQRTDTAAAKSRADVSGRNKKPWRQKGTGRSRHGSRISPLWVGGGRANAPDGTQDHSKDLNQEMKQQALKSALSVRVDENSIYCLEDVGLDEPDTATLNEFFESEGLDDQKVLLLLTDDEKTLRLSTRNLSYCDPFDVESLNTYQVVSHSSIVFSEDALDSITGGEE